MNIERMTKLAEELENPALGVEFDIKLFCSRDRSLFVHSKVGEKHPCGTAFCIGGTACLMFGKVGSRINEDTAQSLLELSNQQTNELFYDFNLTTREQAAAAVRRMIAEEGGQ